MRAARGDRIIVGGRRLDHPRRVGTVVEVHGPDGAPPYRICWDGDDDVHLYVPGSDAVVEPVGE